MKVGSIVRLGPVAEAGAPPVITPSAAWRGLWMQLA